MSIFGWIALVVVVLLVVWAFSPSGRRLLKSIANVGNAAADGAAEKLNATNALGIYKTQIANAVESGRRANAAVELAAKQKVALDRQIADNLKEQRMLTTRIQSVMDNGDPNNTAEGYAAQLARVEEELAKNQEQKKLADQQYEDNLKMVEKFQREIDNARKDANTMGIELERSQAEKELTQLTASLKDKLNLGEVSEARKRVQDQIDANRGASQAARDLSRQGLAEESDAELERKAAAASVLARFKKNDASTAPVGS